MKTTIVSALLFFTALNASAEIAKQTIQCIVKPEEYANNKFEYVTLPPMAIDIKDADATHLHGDIKGGTFTIHKNYQVKIEGFIMKPGNFWDSNGSLMLLTTDLLKLDAAGKAQLLYSDSIMSGRVRNPKQLEAVKAGLIRTEQTISNPEYFAAKNLSSEMPEDMFTTVTVVCELVRN